MNRPDLFILDIDGTLIDSCLLEGDLYKTAVKKVFGNLKFLNRWEHYTQVTDGAILLETVRNNLQREPSRIEISEVKKEFCRLLELIENIPPIRGVEAFISRIKEANIEFVLATGGWKESALIKLHKASLDLSQYKLFSSDDSINRCQIVSKALDEFKYISKPNIYSIGDGLWDLEVAKKLGINFIGMNSRNERNMTELNDYHSVSDFYELLDLFKIKR